MGRASTKQDKTPYQLAREELGLTRQEAEDLLEVIPAERIEKIENGRIQVLPQDVLTMSQKYQKPTLCNYYCSQQCPIGEQYVPRIQVKELPAIIIEMLASLNSVNRSRDRLIDIAADGRLGKDEIRDFITIQNELEHISQTVEALQLWAETLLADGTIDRDTYNKLKATQ